MKNIPANVFEFWSNVYVENPANPHSCWLWRGPIHALGYGVYRTIYATQAAAIVYTGRICGRIQRPKAPALHLTGYDPDRGCCYNRLCVRKDHMPIPFKKCQEKYPKAAQQDTTIHMVLNARGTGAYTIKELQERVFIRHGIRLAIPTIKKILDQAPLYDLMADVRRYVDSGQPVPILPDTRNRPSTSTRPVAV